MPKFIAVYRTIITEIWEVEAEHSEAAKSNLTENGHMICPPFYEEDVQVQRAGTFVYREGQFPSCTEIKPASAEPESGHHSSERQTAAKGWEADWQVSATRTAEQAFR